MTGWEDMITRMFVMTAGSNDLAGILLLMVFNIFVAVLRLPSIITVIINGVLIIGLAAYGVLSPLMFVVIIGFSLFMFFVIRRAGPFSERY